MIYLITNISSTIFDKCMLYLFLKIFIFIHVSQLNEQSYDKVQPLE